MLKLAALSLANRRVSLGLTVLAIALSVAMILGIERLRDGAREGFANSVSGVDLIVASRGNDVQILLATAYGVGFTTNSLSWETYETLAAMPQISWAAPMATGDTYRGYPVIGTTEAYFDHFSHGRGQALVFADGIGFGDAKSAVLGAEVARKLALGVDSQIIASHGSGPVRGEDHDEHPFVVTGVLAPTGTPVDRMIYVPLAGFALLHVQDPEQKDPLSDSFMAQDVSLPESEHADEHEHVEDSEQHDRDDHHNHDAHDAHEDHDAHDDHEAHDDHDAHAHAPDRINAVYVGLHSKAQVLGVQRWIAQYDEDPLTAVMPGVALLQLWSITGIAERTLRVVALAVVVAGLLGMLTMITATLDARRREFAILRAVGATPGRIGALILIEATLITLGGMVLGCAILYAVQAGFTPVLAERVGVDIALGWPSAAEWRLLALALALGLFSSLLPALRVYRVTVSDGLNVRL